MKLLTVLFLLTCVSIVSNANTLRLSEPVATDAYGEIFGAQLNTNLPKVELSALASSPEEYLGSMFSLETSISKVCQQKGCFFIVQAEDRVFRVSFKDYGFFIPTDSGGKRVLLTGELVQKELSPSQAAHFQKDLKADTDSIRAGLVYEIVADSIRIPVS